MQERAEFRAKLVYIGLVSFYNFELQQNTCKLSDEQPSKTREELQTVGFESPTFGLLLVQSVQFIVLVALICANFLFELYKTPLFFAASGLAMLLILSLGWFLNYYLLKEFTLKVKSAVTQIDKVLQLHDWQAELRIERSYLFGFIDYVVTIKPWQSSSSKQLLMLEIPISPETLLESPAKTHRGVEAIQFSNAFGGSRSPAVSRAASAKTPRPMALRSESASSASPRAQRKQ